MRPALLPSNVCDTAVPEEEAGREGKQEEWASRDEWQAGKGGLQGTVAA